MDFKKLIQVADVFGTETRKLAELKEGELADRLAQDLGWDQEDSEEIEDAVDATGNDPAELADIITDAPAQPQAPETGDAPARPAQSGPGAGIDADQPPTQPQAPQTEPAPQADTTAPEASQSAANSAEWEDPDNITFSGTVGGEARSITYNPNRNTLRIQGEDYDRSFNGIAIRDGQVVAGDYGFPVPPVEERLPFGEELQDTMMQEIGDAVEQQAQEPEAQTTAPEQPTAQGDSAADVAADDAARTTQGDPAVPVGTAPEQPQAPAQDDAPQADTATPEPQGDPAVDAETDDAARTQGGDALAGRLDTETPSLLDAYNDGGRRALDSVRDLQTGLSRLGFDPNGIDGKYGRGTYAAVQEFQRQNGLTVDGEAGPTTMAKLQELLNGGAGEEQPQGDSAADVEADDAARTAPQTDAELDADSADTATPAQAPQTDAELDADSADTATPQQIDPDALAAVRRVDNPARVGTDAGDGMVWVIAQNGNFFTRTRPNNPVVAAQQAAAASLRSQQNNSKEFDMKKFIKESRELEECGPEMSMPQNEGNPVTMSVTLNASGEQNVQDLIRMMQLAGAKDAAPVADMHVGPVDKHDDMVAMMRMMDAPEESVEEEWDNAPEEDYKDHKTMTKDLSGGLNREKKAYAKAQDGDNAMAVESIKDVLIQALEEKYANDAQRMAVHAAKAEKKKKK